MKSRPIRQSYESRDRPRAGGKTITLLAVLTLAIGATGPLRAAVIDDMSGPRPRWSDETSLAHLTANYVEGQLVFAGQFPSAYPFEIGGVGYGVDALWNVDRNGRTLEVRVDVVSANENDVFVFLGVSGDKARYDLIMDQDEIWLQKVGDAVVLFFNERTPTRNENVTAVLSLTGRGDTLTITTRILDRERAGTVLYEKTVTDGPGSDVGKPSSPPKPGIDVYAADWGPPAMRSGNYLFLAAHQFGEEGKTPPPVKLVLDNLEYELYDTPKLTVEKAVCLSWPVTGTACVLEAAPSANGPWTPVTDGLGAEVGGKYERWVVAEENAKFYRLRSKAP